MIADSNKWPSKWEDKTGLSCCLMICGKPAVNSGKVKSLYIALAHLEQRYVGRAVGKPSFAVLY